MASFNLIDQPWIPCVLRGDGRVQALGLRDTLLRASTVREISAASPLVTVALHRLLLAVLHRVFGPPSARAWRELWKRGAWDAIALDTYLERWRERFDLFHPERPFYQDAGLGEEYAGPISKLRHELASGNNATLFDHTRDQAPPALTPAEAAADLIAYQAFALGGTITRERGQGPSAKAALLAKGAIGLAKGATLFETLMLNLHRYDGGDGHPFSFDPAHDQPAWERDEPARAAERLPDGYLDWLTWQSRRVRLLPDEAPGAPLVVRRAVTMKGYQLPDGVEPRDHEPMQAFRAIEKAHAGQSPWLVVGFEEGRALWRDSLALVQSIEGRQQRPKLADWLAELVDEAALTGGTVIPMEFFGLCADRAKPLFWRHERLPLPLAYLSDQSLRDNLTEALRVAEGTARDLYESVRRLAARLVAPNADPDNLIKEAAKDAQRLQDALAPERRYWPRLEAPFKQLLLALPATQGADPAEARRQHLAIWAATVERTARQAFEETTRDLESSARALRAVALAEREFRGRLRTRFAPPRDADASSAPVRAIVLSVKGERPTKRAAAKGSAGAGQH